jgi:uncharacterized protein
LIKNKTLLDFVTNYQKCQPPVWLRGGHAQTIYAHFTSNPKLQFPIEPVKINVGTDDLSCYLFKGTSNTIISLFHGLGGSTQSSYIIRLANLLSETGHSVLMVNHRGADANKPEKSQELYHSGRSDDASKVMEWVKASFPKHFHIAIGFSMSANILLLNSAGYKSQNFPDFTIAVNGPIHLADSARRLDSGLNHIYARKFTYDLYKMLGQTHIPISIQKFDQMITAPHNNFSSADEYYEKCSAFFQIENIKIPTLVLTAEDDPFINSEWYLKAKWPESVYLRIEKQGGHLGYLHQGDGKISRWMDQFLFDFIGQITELTA